MSRSLSRVLVLSFAFALHAQEIEKLATPAEMPIDRVSDSYAIYQIVLPSDAIEWSDVPRVQWLLEDTTTAVPLGASCLQGGFMNPHQSLEAPDEAQADLAEVLKDFDAHCHERYRFRGDLLATKIPVHMMDEAAQHRYWAGVNGAVRNAKSIMEAPPTPDEFKGAAGLHSFSAVYFNRKHSVAIVSFGMGCGSLCGNWTWVALEKTPAGWRRLPWGGSSVMS